MDQRLLGHAHEPGKIRSCADALSRQLDAHLARGVEREQQQEAQQDRAPHARPQPTSPTPTAIRAMARARGSVMRSLKISRPPSMTPTMVMLPAITPSPNGTRERKASQAKKVATKAASASHNAGCAANVRK